MKDLKEELDDKRFFFGWVHQEILNTIPFLEKILLNPNLKDEIYEKAVQLGYDRKKSMKTIQLVGKEFMDNRHHPIPIEIPPSDYFKTALFHLVQKRISNSQVLPEDVLFLDQLLPLYDPLTPDNYLESKPNDIDIPKFKKENWIDEIKCMISKNDLIESNWFTLYSYKRIHLKEFFQEEGIEHGHIASTFLPKGKIGNLKGSFKDLKLQDFLETPISKTVNEFKKLPTLQRSRYIFEKFLIVKTNHWRMHSPNELVRLDQKFIDENNLVWDDSDVLDLNFDDQKVVKYQLWASSFEGDSRTRHRTACGVRLQVNIDFLKKYLEEKNLAILVFYDKIRKLADPGIKETKTIDSKHLKDYHIYSETDFS